MENIWFFTFDVFLIVSGSHCSTVVKEEEEEDPLCRDLPLFQLGKRRLRQNQPRKIVAATSLLFRCTMYTWKTLSDVRSVLVLLARKEVKVITGAADIQIRIVR